MRLRILLEPRYGASYQQILAMAQATEEAGFDAFFRSDHYLGIDAADAGYAPTDSWATLAGLAVQTRRIRLGTLMTASTFRHPGPLAITVATVHVMSGGRAELGIGRPGTSASTRPSASRSRLPVSGSTGWRNSWPSCPGSGAHPPASSSATTESTTTSPGAPTSRCWGRTGRAPARPEAPRVSRPGAPVPG